MLGTTIILLKLLELAQFGGMAEGRDEVVAGLSVFDDPVIRVLAVIVIVIWLLGLLASKANRPK